MYLTVKSTLYNVGKLGKDGQRYYNTSVPYAIVKLLNLKEGDRLTWEIGDTITIKVASNE